MIGLARTLEPLSEETTIALQEHWTDKSGIITTPKECSQMLTDSEWHIVPLFPSVGEVVAQVLARLFVGPALCHNKAWLSLSVEYQGTVFPAAQALHLWPKILRENIVHWFLPSCQKLRAQVQEAESMIVPLVEAIRTQRRETVKSGHPAPKSSTGMEFLEESANGENYNPTTMALIFSVATQHSSTDLIMKVILDLCLHPDLFDRLRSEITSAYKDDGWSQKTITNLKLLDSVMKETQRMRPAGTCRFRFYSRPHKEKDAQLLHQIPCAALQWVMSYFTMGSESQPVLRRP